jgi:hypothetical protein
MKKLFEKLSSAMRRATVALLTVALGIFGLALGLALLGLRQPAERYAQVATEITVRGHLTRGSSRSLACRL